MFLIRIYKVEPHWIDTVLNYLMASPLSVIFYAISSFVKRNRFSTVSTALGIIRKLMVTSDNCPILDQMLLRPVRRVSR